MSVSAHSVLAPTCTRVSWPRWLKWPMGGRHHVESTTTRRFGYGCVRETDLDDDARAQYRAVAERAIACGSVTFWAPGESRAADTLRELVMARIRDLGGEGRVTVRYVSAADYIGAEAEA